VIDDFVDLYFFVCSASVDLVMDFSSFKQAILDVLETFCGVHWSTLDGLEC